MKKLAWILLVLFCIPKMAFSECHETAFYSGKECSAEWYKNDDVLINKEYSETEKAIIKNHKLVKWLNTNKIVYWDYDRTRPLFMTSDPNTNEATDYMLIPLPKANNEWLFCAWEYVMKFIKESKGKHYVDNDKRFDRDYIYIVLNEGK